MKFATFVCVVSRIDPHPEPSEIRLVFLDHAHARPDNGVGRREVTLGNLSRDDRICIVAWSVRLAHEVTLAWSS
jgi:hypothetical protein